MKLTKEQEEKMAKVIEETKVELLRALMDDDDLIQDMVEKVFGKIEDDDKWILCCNELVAKITKGVNYGL